MNNAVFGKAMENIKFFTKNLLALEMRKIQMLVNKPVYLGFSILDLSRTVRYECWYMIM